MRLGVCTTCGAFGEIHLHHVSKEMTIVVCPSCHFLEHYPVPHKKLPPDLRFKLDLMAAKYEIETRGLYVSAIVMKMLKVKLSRDDKKILEAILEFFGMSFKEVKGKTTEET